MVDDMDTITLRAFADELTKIAETPAEKANAMFGLPLEPRKRNTRLYDQGSTAAQSPDRSQSPVDGQSTANVAAGNTMSPATGPGGV